MSIKPILLLLGLVAAVPVIGNDEWQEKFNKIKETRIKNGCDPDPAMQDFVGGAYQGAGSYIISGNVANGPEGPIIRSGDTFFTPDGVYVKSGDTYLRSRGGAVIRAGDTFLAGENTKVKAGNTYVGAGGVSIAGGNAMFRSEAKETASPYSSPFNSYPYTPYYAVGGAKSPAPIRNAGNNVKAEMEAPKTYPGTYPDKVWLFTSTFADIIAKKTPSDLKKGETLRLTFRVTPNGSLEDLDVSMGDPNSPLVDIATRALQQSLDMVGPMPAQEEKTKGQGLDMVLKFSSF